MLDKKLERVKYRKGIRNLEKIKGNDLEESLRRLTAPNQRLKSNYVNLKRYKTKYFTAAFCSLFIFIVMVILNVRFVNKYLDVVIENNLEWFISMFYILTCVFTGLPIIIMSITILMDSEVGKYILAERELKQFYDKMQRDIDLCHHCCEMILIANNNVNYEYFLDKCAVCARKALISILKCTNNLIRRNYFIAIKYQSRRLFSKKVEGYLNEINGALIVSYRGRVPKYVLDGFEQINANMVELRKREI